MYKQRLLKDYGYTLYTISENGEATVYDFTNYTFDPGIYQGMTQYEVDQSVIHDNRPTHRAKCKALKNLYYTYFDHSEGSHWVDTQPLHCTECLIGIFRTKDGARAAIQRQFDRHGVASWDDLPF